jgi:hypothetical protein
VTRRGYRKCCDCRDPFTPVHRNHKRCASCAVVKRDAFFAKRKAGVYGRGAHIACPSGCGLTYETFKVGLTFLQARRDIIAIGTDKKTGRTKYGRRNGVLGFMHEQKQLAWKAHVAECETINKPRRKRAV